MIVAVGIALVGNLRRRCDVCVQAHVGGSGSHPVYIIQRHRLLNGSEDIGKAYASSVGHAFHRDTEIGRVRRDDEPELSARKLRCSGGASVGEHLRPRERAHAVFARQRRRDGDASGVEDRRMPDDCRR